MSTRPIRPGDGGGPRLRRVDVAHLGSPRRAAGCLSRVVIEQRLRQIDHSTHQVWWRGASGTRDERAHEVVVMKPRREMVDAVDRSRENVVAESPADRGGPPARLATLDETRRRRRERASASPRKRRAESSDVRSRAASRARAMREHRSIVLAIRRTLSHNRDEIKTVSSGGAQAMRKRSRFRKRVVRIFRRRRRHRRNPGGIRRALMRSFFRATARTLFRTRSSAHIASRRSKRACRIGVRM